VQALRDYCLSAASLLKGNTADAAANADSSDTADYSQVAAKLTKFYSD